MKATTEWCHEGEKTTAHGIIYVRGKPGAVFGFCSEGLKAYDIPDGVRVRLQFDDEYVKGASCGIPARKDASIMILQLLRAEGFNAHEAVFWWPEYEVDA
jgi:hypothetical protein